MLTCRDWNLELEMKTRYVKDHYAKIKGGEREKKNRAR